MPTKEEILKERTTPFENIQKFSHNHIYALRVSVLIGFEEYAKQEAMEFSLFTTKNRVKFIGWSYDRLWNEYQLHKATEQKKIADAMQTHDELIKAKKVK